MLLRFLRVVARHRTNRVRGDRLLRRRTPSERTRLVESGSAASRRQETLSQSDRMVGRAAAAAAAMLLLLAPEVAVAQDASTRMRIQILPEAGDSDESAADVLGRLRDGLAVGQDGTSGVDAYSLLSDIQADTLSATMSRDPDHAAVDVYSESAFNAVANDDFKVTAGGKFEGRIQETADLIVGALELQSLKKASLIAGDHAEISVNGDLGTSATGAVSLDAATLTSQITSNTGITAGGDIDLAAGGVATLGANSLLAQVRGDIDAAGAALKLSGTKGLSVVAGSVDVQTPGAVRIAGKGGVAELGGEGSTEFVGFIWTGPSTFDTYTTTVPEVVSDVTEVVIRASYAGNAAEVVADAPTTLTMEIGEADANGAVTYTKVWASAVGVGTFSLDGLVISLDRGYAVKSIKLSAGDSVYSGWSQVVFNLGVTTVGGLKLASASSLEATAAKGVLLNAGSVQLSAQTDLDVSAAISASILSKDVSVAASDKMAAAAGDFSIQASDTIAAFSGGEAMASVGSLTAESRGAAALTAAGAVSISAEEANVAVSGDLEATADNVRLNTASLETMTSELSATASESASLYTNDALLSLSGKLDAFMGDADVLLDGDLNVKSAGDVKMRNRDLTVESDTTKVVSREMHAIVGNLKLHAEKAEPHHVVTVPCADCDASTNSEMLAELAELLEIPADRLRVRVKDGASGGAGRRRMETAPIRNIREWTTAEIVAWLRDVLSLPVVADGALREAVDGSMAVEMLRSDWMELGATGLKAAKIITEVRREDEKQEAGR